jgi:hypothetical protein
LPIMMLPRILFRISFSSICWIWPHCSLFNVIIFYMACIWNGTFM